MTESNTSRELALICDCDGVLIASEAISHSVLVKELQGRWPDIDVAPLLLPLSGVRTEQVLESVAASIKRFLPAVHMKAICSAVQAACVKAPVISGIEQALAQVRLRKACASNSISDYVETVMQRTGLIQYFGDHLYCADTVARPKPSPDVYLAAAEGLGVAPYACLVVEDSATGAKAALAAGMTVLGFVGGGAVIGQQIDALRCAGVEQIFADMTRLPDLVSDWTLCMANRDVAPSGQRKVPTP